MICYLDTSAASKLLLREAETDALKAQLDELHVGGLLVMGSSLLETELRRTATRAREPQSLVTEILDRLEMFELDQSVFRAAGLLPGEHLRSLDALHIAAALRVGADVMISYDQRQIDAARDVGLNTLSPE
ncbi:type II toxin-antitoxin system VapC family toxin [Homoserinimonas sp. A447]